MKSWYESKVVWAGLITVGASVAGMCGIVIDAETQDQIIELVLLGVTAISGLFGIYGRYKTTKQIK